MGWGAGGVHQNQVVLAVAAGECGSVERQERNNRNSGIGSDNEASGGTLYKL